MRVLKLNNFNSISLINTDISIFKHTIFGIQIYSNNMRDKYIQQIYYLPWTILKKVKLRKLYYL